MIRVASVRAEPGFALAVSFSDGTAAVVPMADRLFGPVFEPLRDSALFAQVAVDAFGAVAWPNGADLAPDALHARATAARRAAG